MKQKEYDEELLRLNTQKQELQEELRNMRKRRHNGMDDDKAEDIVEEIYRDLLAVEKEIETLIQNR